MFAPFAFLANVASEALLLVASASPASPAQVPLDVGRSTAQGSSRFYDVQVRGQIASSMFYVLMTRRHVVHRPTEEVEEIL